MKKPEIFYFRLKRAMSYYNSLNSVNFKYIVDILKKAKPFLIRGNIQELYSQQHIKQDYKNTLKLPFDTLFICFERLIVAQETLSGVSISDMCVTSTTETLFDFEFWSELNKEPEKLIVLSSTIPFFITPSCQQPCLDETFQVEERKMWAEMPGWGDIFRASCYYYPGRQSCPILQKKLKLLNLAINTINFLNASNVRKVPFISSTKSLREKGGEEAVRNAPPEYYICKVEMPSPKYKQIKEVSSDRQQFKFSFDVRGHFRQLLSDFYKHKKGQMIWVPPFVKGEGVYIPKSYLFVEKRRSE